MTDIIITWPKTRPLIDYLEQLEQAHSEGRSINFRVASIPKGVSRNGGDRCYVVHDGYIRGWNRILTVQRKIDVIDPVTGDFWPEGIFIVRHPLFHPIFLGESMVGFQGYRYVK